MKYYIISLLSLCLIMTSCDDTENTITYESTGQIINYDFSFSPCSGGMVVVLDDDETSYRIEEFPSDFDSDFENVTFPLDIRLNWTFNRQCSSNVFIDVDDIEYVD